MSGLTRYLANPHASGSSLRTVKRPSEEDVESLSLQVRKHADYTRTDVYVGAAGIALLHLHLGKTEEALEIAEKALERGRIRSGCSFLCGEVGLLAVAAVSTYCEDPDDARLQGLLGKIEEAFAFVLAEDACDELLYGRAGYLYATQYLRKNIRAELLGSNLSHLSQQTADAILHSGLRSAPARGPPLSWSWHDKAYFGAAHGFAGILTILLQEHRVFGTQISPEGLQAMKETIDWLTTFQTKDGNLPSSIESGHSHLVQFCHGAPGLVLLLTEAVKTFADREKPWLEKATSAGLCIWQKGLLVKGVGLCHGIAGNAYAFAALYAATGEQHWLDYRNAFASLAVNLLSDDRLHTPSHPYSLYEGIAGLTWLLSDVSKGCVGGFPAFSDVAL